MYLGFLQKIQNSHRSVQNMTIVFLDTRMLEDVHITVGPKIVGVYVDE